MVVPGVPRSHMGATASFKKVNKRKRMGKRTTRWTRVQHWRSYWKGSHRDFVSW